MDFLNRISQAKAAGARDHRALIQVYKLQGGRIRDLQPQAPFAQLNRPATGGVFAADFTQRPPDQIDLASARQAGPVGGVAEDFGDVIAQPARAGIARVKRLRVRAA